MKIKSLQARPILDSRGQWTVEAEIIFADGVSAVASVPQGKSTGSSEAVALPAKKAVHNIEKIILPKLRGKNISTQADLDGLLTTLDGTEQKKNLGANAILGVSIAYLRAYAEAKHIPLWKHIASIAESKPSAPRLFINVVNGGLHAGNDLHFQEYLIIPKAKTIRESVAVGTTIYQTLKKALIRTKQKGAANIGDEGGYAPDFKDDMEPFRILRSVMSTLHLETAVDFGMDAAATDAKLDDRELGAFYQKFIRQYRPLYIEDPYPEDQFEKFSSLKEKYAGGKNANLWIAGDDLTTTNVRRMERAHAEASVNAVIIKPNQIGSVTEAIDAVKAARRYGWKVVASHRSGETNDTFIADFAYGIGADGLKLGAPARGERIAKYNRLLEIEAGN